MKTPPAELMDLDYLQRSPRGKALEAGRAGLARAAGNHAAEIAALVPLVLELAATPRGLELGITVSTLRAAAYDTGLLTGDEKVRELSYLGAVMRIAGLKSTGEFRRSDLEVTHGNLQAVWRIVP